MSDLLTILPKIKANPAMYLGKTSVSDLFMFLVGYECARSELSINLIFSLLVKEEIFILC
jgi:hypothetical protein